MKLRELRQEKRLSQAKFANIFGLTQGTYSNYENETTQPDIKILIKIADYYHVTLDYLVGRTFANDAGYLSDDEKELLDNYRKLSKDNKFTYLIEGKGMVLAQKF